MLELTKEECFALEKCVTEKLCASLQHEKGMSQLYECVTQIAVRATIDTIREYERMKAGN